METATIKPQKDNDCVKDANGKCVIEKTCSTEPKKRCFEGKRVDGCICKDSIDYQEN